MIAAGKQVIVATPEGHPCRGRVGVVVEYSFHHPVKPAARVRFAAGSARWLEAKFLVSTEGAGV